MDLLFPVWSIANLVYIFCHMKGFVGHKILMGIYQLNSRTCFGDLTLAQAGILSPPSHLKFKDMAKLCTPIRSKRMGNALT